MKKYILAFCAAAAILTAIVPAGAEQPVTDTPKATPFNFKRGIDLFFACRSYGADPYQLPTREQTALAVCAAYMSGALEMYAGLSEVLQPKEICIPDQDFKKKDMIKVFMEEADKNGKLLELSTRDAVFNAFRFHFPC